MFLAGDIGGTKVNLALGHFEDGPCTFIRQASYPTKSESSLERILHRFLDEGEEKPATACLGIAGPVQNGKVRGTNLPWTIEADELARATGLPRVHLLNDLEANAYGIFALQPADFHDIQPGRPAAVGNRAVLSAGTGLGEAGLFWDGLRYHPFACEGGHAEFSPRDEEDLALYQFIRPRCASPGWEEFLSGRAFMRLYEFMLLRTSTHTPSWLAEEMETGAPAAAVTRAGNENRCPVCRRTNQLFLKLYAMEAANLALKLMATGGVYLGGGIIPKLLPSLDPTAFARTFQGDGPLRELLAQIPIRIILNDKAALLGTAWFAHHRAWRVADHS